jgi:hypothetical protein
MTPDMLVMLITLEEKPGVCDSRVPLSSNPRNAVVTKNVEKVLIAYKSAHSLKVSLLNNDCPKVSASLSSGAEGSPRNGEVGPTCPALET